MTISQVTPSLKNARIDVDEIHSTRSYVNFKKTGIVKSEIIWTFL